MKEGFTYILLCADGSYYTGSTVDLDRRLEQHEAGEGANHTAKRLPVKLVYYEHYQRVDQAFYREKQIQGWSRKKKEALINGEPELLPELAMAYRDIKGGFECLSPQTTAKNLSPQTSAKNHSPLGKRNNIFKYKPIPNPNPNPKPEVLEGEVLEGEVEKKEEQRSVVEKKVGLRPEALEGQH